MLEKHKNTDLNIVWKISETYVKIGVLLV